MANNEIDIILKFLVDQASQKNASAAINGLTGGNTGGAASQSQQVWEALTDYADKYNLTVQQAAAQISKMGNAGAGAEQKLLQYYQEYDNILAAHDKVALENQAATNQMEAAYQGANAEAEKLPATMDKVAKNTNAAGKEIRNFFRYSQEGVAAFMALQVGTELTRISKSMLAPIDSYTKYYGQTSAASSRYLEAQRQIEQSTIRVGGTLSQAITPAIESAARLTGDLADLFEKYPAIASGAVGVAGTALVAGTLLQTAGQITMGIMAIKGLAASITAKNMGSAAAQAISGTAVAAGSASGFMATIAPVLPWLVASVVAIVVASEIGKQNAENTREKIAAGTFKGPVFLPGGTTPAQGNKMLGLDGSGGTAKEAISAIGQAAVDAFVQNQQAVAEAEKQYAKDRTQIVEDAAKAQAKSEDQYEKKRTGIVDDEGKRRLKSEKSYGDSLSDIIKAGINTQVDDNANLLASRALRLRDWAKDEDRTETDYYASRMKVVQDGYKSEIRAEEDHQRQVLQMRKEHNLAVGDLLDQQDAFGLLKENRRYELQRKDAEDTYNVEAARRNADLAQRLAEMDTQFSLERSRRQEDQAQTLADEDAAAAEKRTHDAKLQAEKIAQLGIDHQEELDQIKEDANDKLRQLALDHADETSAAKQDTKDKLDELDRNYADEATRRQNAFNDQLRLLDANLLGEYGTKAAWYARESELLQSYLDRWKSMGAGSNLPNYNTPPTIDYKGPGYQGARAGGGPVWDGLWQLHDNEVVLTGQQQALMMGLISGSGMSGGQRSTLVLQQNYQFHGTFTEGDKAAFKDIAKDSAYEAFTEIIQ